MQVMMIGNRKGFGGFNANIFSEAETFEVVLSIDLRHYRPKPQQNLSQYNITKLGKNR